jgi:hypothetical protein
MTPLQRQRQRRGCEKRDHDCRGGVYEASRAANPCARSTRTVRTGSVARANRPM